MTETGKATILVCDDEPHIVHVVAAKLRNAGFEVETAADGQEALQRAKARRPDLIISDFQMPNMSGLELAARLRAEPALRDVPIVMLTARGFAIEPAELASTGIRCVMAKPFSPREVLAAARKLLDAVAATAMEN
jgi:CheY-like chemotaxis protein